MVSSWEPSCSGLSLSGGGGSIGFGGTGRAGSEVRWLRAVVALEPVAWDSESNPALRIGLELILD